MVLIWCSVLAAAPRPPPQTSRNPEWIRAGPIGTLTAARRQVLVGDFGKFIKHQTNGATLEQLAQRDHPQLSIRARDYGFSLYEKQRLQADLRDLLLGI